MKRRTATRSLAVALALASIAACTAPATMPWEDRRPTLTGTV